MPPARYLTAQEAAAQLNVRLPTLYAYVSRGLIRSEAGGPARRDRRYHAEDVRRLKERQEQRRDPARAAARALHWGAPVLESALTLISDERVFYRGHDAVRLAAEHPAEAVAGLLWLGDLHAEIAALTGRGSKADRAATAGLIARVQAHPLIDAFHLALLLAAPADPAGFDLRPAAAAQTGGRILRLLTAVAAGQTSEAGLAETLARAWRPQQPAAAGPLLNAALILLADHELNISAFTARCVASAGATPYQVVAAGLAAVQGAKHGGSVSRVEAWLAEVRTPAKARPAVKSRVKHGEGLPGFGHALYPGGDPRGRALLEHTAAVLPRSPAVALSRAIVEETRALIGEEPNVDFALATLTRALGLREGYGLGLFALGRTMGWVAHAIEQYQSDRLIRPRARYVGVIPPAPQTSTTSPS